MKNVVKNKVGRNTGFTLMEIMIVVAVIGLLCAMIIPGFIRARTTSQMNECISNLRQIDEAKQQWALEQRQTTTATPAGSDLQPYLGRGSAGKLPTCPADTQVAPTFNASYRIHNVGTAPTCRRVPSTHILP